MGTLGARVAPGTLPGVNGERLPIVADRAAALAAGHTESAVTRRLANGRWTSLRRGAFSPYAELEADQRWRAEVVAAAGAFAGELVLSHAHAARAHGLPQPLGGWGPLTFTRTSGSRRRDTALVYVASLDPSDITIFGRMPVTSLARTVIDCARTLPGRDALAMADAALRSGRLTAGDLGRTLQRQGHWPGVARARVVVGRADGRRESPAESWSAWAFAEHGVPAPLWQVEVRDARGALAGRVDSWWKEGVAGEVDGRAKYRLRALERGGVSADTLARVLDEERLREMAVRRTGALVVRWDPRDVLRAERADDLAGYLRDELARAGGFTGRLYLT